MPPLKTAYLPEELDQAVADVLEANPQSVQLFRMGKTVLGYLVGQVVRVMAGRVNPRIVNEALIRALAIEVNRG